MTGYLTTVTSDEENSFVSDRARANVGGVETWAAGLGGRDDIDATDSGSTSMCPSITGSDRGEGNWYWVTGKAGRGLCTNPIEPASDQSRRHCGDKVLELLQQPS